ncbi:MAG: zinc ribbon domain-containing protein [Woeseiaceae bacterium]
MRTRLYPAKVSIIQDESLRIVSDAVWQRVQIRLAKSRENSKVKGGRPARYLLSGLLTCASCGGHYVLRNGRAYCCSSHTNGRDSMCEQRRTIARRKVESSLLEGIKQEFLAPGVIKELSKRVQSRLREMKQPDKGRLKRDLKLIERQIDNVVESLSTIGTSEALTAKLRQLEADKAALAAQMAVRPAPVQIVPDVAKHVRQVVNSLETLPENPHRDNALMDKARVALRGLLGNVTVIEESAGVFAELQLGRACITAGAEERT